MNAHDRRIFARKCKRHGMTAEYRSTNNPHWIPAWAPLINGRHVTTDTYRGEIGRRAGWSRIVRRGRLVDLAKTKE